MLEQPLILLVEDDPDHAELIVENLRKNDIPHELVHFSDGQAALDYLLGSPAGSPPGRTPDLILLDLRLPKVDGLTVLETVKSSDRLGSVPVVILTTSDAEEDVRAAYKRRANSYLVKPFHFDRFCKMLEEIELYWLSWNRPPRG